MSQSSPDHRDHVDDLLKHVPADRRDFLRGLLLAGAALGGAMLPASEVVAQNGGGGGKGKGGGGKGKGKGDGGGAGGGKGKGKGGGGKGKGSGGGGGATGAAGAAGAEGKCKDGPAGT